MFQPLRLKRAKPILSTRRKLIFAHPHNDQVLVKIIKVRATYRAWGIKKLYKGRRRNGVYVDFIRMLKESIFIQTNCRRYDCPVQQVFGVVETDLGLGLVVEKIQGRNGKLAPNLRTILLGRRFGPEMRNQLAVFLHDILRSNIIINDFNPQNLVYIKGQANSGRFVLVDGFGEKSVIPLCSMSKLLNRWNTLRKWRQLQRWSQQLLDTTITARERNGK